MIDVRVPTPKEYQDPYLYVDNKDKGYTEDNEKK